MKEAEWFENWFNTKWYHILYGNRDYTEASQFIETLSSFLEPKKDSLLIDAACGAGRHSIHLNKLGFEVYGFDLSPESIEVAKRNENETLKFEVADLRTFTVDHKVDYVFNLFTSFGYFNSKEDNLAVLAQFHKALKPSGKLVIDFFNSELVIKNLVNEEQKEVEGIVFDIKRFVEDNRIVKKIRFNTSGSFHEYEERVSAFSLTDFNSMISESGFTITHTFGDYSLNNFDQMSSPRLLIIAEKS